jgi:signal transduction histidine kinase
LLRLVEEVLLYADARDDQLALSLSAVDCRQLWSEILDKHELQIAKSGISVQSSGPGMVRADRDKMEKVLSTLLDVSLSLAAPEAKMEIAFSPSSNAVKMSVSVNSVRLEESEFQELQNPFERSSRREGLGLELPLARHIVRAHGGFIEVNTTQDGGLVFEVHLPDGAAADS